MFLMLAHLHSIPGDDSDVVATLEDDVDDYDEHEGEEEEPLADDPAIDLDKHEAGRTTT